MAENPVENIARSYFDSEKVVAHYLKAGSRVGLWESEKTLFSWNLLKNEVILDLGCGAGRIAFGLKALGYEEVLGADFSPGMVEAAEAIAAGNASKVQFSLADARDLPWDDGHFDGIVFGFNGLFMIPGRENRAKALREIYRVLRFGGCFIFTGHDRSQRNQSTFWQHEQRKWDQNERVEKKTDFGDLIEETDLGLIYIHSTSQPEVEALLKDAGFSSSETWLRRELGKEGERVRDFSDECRFWITRKPER